MTASDASIISLAAVSYRAGRKTLIDGVSLDLRPATLHVLVGPNGAGKTTLFRIASGEQAPTSGSVFCDASPIGSWPAWRLAAKRAVMTQSASLSFPFVVADLVALGLDAVGRRQTEDERIALVAGALASADAGHLGARDYASLSGGEQQRVQFARVMCQLAAGRLLEERQVLFLDEPVASLDLRHQIALMQSARAVARSGTSVLAIVHDLNLAATFADDLIVLSQGRLVARGRPADILDDGLIERVFGVRRKAGADESAAPVVLPQYYV